MIATATPTQIALHEAKKARMARMFPGRTVTRRKGKTAPVAVSEPPKAHQPRPEVQERSHVDCYRAWRAITGAPMTPKEFFIAACWLAGYSVEAIRSPSRERPLVAARRAVIRSMAQRFPKMSSPKIGEFVNREYTTVLHSMGQVIRSEASGTSPVRKRNKPRVQNEHREKIITMRLSGMGYSQISEKLGVSRDVCWSAMDRYRKRLAAEGSDHKAIKDARYAA